MKKVLQADFFNQDTVQAAQDLLGKFLVRRSGGREWSMMVTETEAYDGLKDLASHASYGLTPRTKVMFGQPGHFYVYLCYGIHYLLNVVTRESGYPGAVLIRQGLAKTQDGPAVLRGPAKVTQFLGIDKNLNGAPASRAAGLWFEDRGSLVGKRDIKKMPRVGVAYAGPVWSSKKLRFFMADGVKAALD